MIAKEFKIKSSVLKHLDFSWFFVLILNVFFGIWAIYLLFWDANGSGFITLVSIAIFLLLFFFLFTSLRKAVIIASFEKLVFSDDGKWSVVKKSGEIYSALPENFIKKIIKMKSKVYAFVECDKKILSFKSDDFENSKTFYDFVIASIPELQTDSDYVVFEPEKNKL